MRIPYENLSGHLRQVLNTALHFSIENSHREVIPEILLLCLFNQDESVAAKALRGCDVNSAKLTSLLPKGNSQGFEFIPRIGSISQELIKTAINLAKNNEPYVGTQHLLLAMFSFKHNDLSKIMSGLALNRTMVNKKIEEVKQKHLIDKNKSKRLVEETQTEFEDEFLGLSTGSKEKKSPLQLFAKELTSKTYPSAPVIGRIDELNSLITVLGRKEKNNPLLLGDPGVGKTALVEGLANLIAKHNTPAWLLDKKIFALDINSLVAGAIYRGEFESRIKDLIEEITDREDCIIFIDEIHMIMGAGATHGSLDAANILKPALARGEIRCIGATTFQEYRKHIKNDPALERRFHPITLDEPDQTETLKILKGLKNKYEKFHQVKIYDEALECAVELSDRFTIGRHFPDKAIDLLDQACATKKNTLTTARQKKIARLKNQLYILDDKIDEAAYSEELGQVNIIKAQINLCSGELDALVLLEKDKLQTFQVCALDIAALAAKEHNLQTEDLLNSGLGRIDSVQKKMNRELIGQEAAVAGICAILKRNIIGPKNTAPLAFLAFQGPSGCGKTYGARLLAKHFFHSEQALVKIDMSEYSEKHQIAKLIGAPPGYVGYNEDSHVLESIRMRPSCVILFDEIEKAHPDIFNLLLQVMDQGYLMDATGQKVDFKNSIVILTSNLPIDRVIGFGEIGTEQKVSGQSLNKFLRQELINRLDEIIQFENLSELAMEKITELEWKKLTNWLGEKYPDGAWKKLAMRQELKSKLRKSSDVRDLLRNFKTEVQQPLLEKIITQ